MTVDGWAYYDVDGKRVPSNSSYAVFKGMEALLPGGLPASPWRFAIPTVEYREVHAIDRPDDRRKFASRSGMRAWFKEQAKEIVQGDALRSSRYWRERAEEARSKGEEMHDAAARMTMRSIADTYVRMAERTAQREASAPPLKSRLS